MDEKQHSPPRTPLHKIMGNDLQERRQSFLVGFPCAPESNTTYLRNEGRPRFAFVADLSGRIALWCTNNESGSVDILDWTISRLWGPFWLVATGILLFELCITLRSLLRQWAGGSGYNTPCLGIPRQCRGLLTCRMDGTLDCHNQKFHFSRLAIPCVV